MTPKLKNLLPTAFAFGGVHPKTHQWVKLHTYGGSLSENATQGIARDTLAYAMVRLENKGYPIFIHVHDEPGADVPYGKGSLEEFKSLMLQAEPWMEGLPLAINGYEAERFKK